MNRDRLKKILKEFQEGKVKEEEVLDLFSELPYRFLASGICLDTHREMRCGYPEVIYGKDKTIHQLLSILSSVPSSEPLLITKVDREKGEVLEKEVSGTRYFSEALILVRGKEFSLSPPWKDRGDVLIITAGASDLPVALEAYGCGLFLDLDMALISDVGVAGIHRLLPYMESIRQARLLIVVAGMEGALASVLSGMTGKPILGVPTSVGYGVNFGGIVPLFSMLNSCAGGIGVLNVDNGFGAALLAWRILHSFS